MDVVPEPGPARVFDRREAAADALGPLEAQRLQAGAAEGGLEDEAVMPRPQDDAVVRGYLVILTERSRNSLVYVVLTSKGLSMPT
jgi:hypothetical protein